LKAWSLRRPLVISSLILVMLAACGGGSRSGAPPLASTSSGPDLGASREALLSFEAGLNEAVKASIAAFTQSSNDALQVQESLQRSQAATNSQSSAAQNAMLQTCQQYGFASAQCQKAGDQAVSGASGSSQQADAAIRAAQARAAQDLAAITSALRQLGGLMSSQATTFASLSFPSAVKTDADAVSNALSTAATAAQNAAGQTGSSLTAAHSYMDGFNGAMNQYRVALSRLHADVGLSPPTAYPV
jgi:hypothetical protein